MTFAERFIHLNGLRTGFPVGFRLMYRVRDAAGFVAPGPSWSVALGEPGGARGAKSAGAVMWTF